METGNLDDHLMEKIRTMLSHLRVVCITKVFQKQYYKGNGNSVLKNIYYMDGAKIVLTNGAIIYYKSMYFVARKVTGEKYYNDCLLTDAWLLLF